jgi:hypothetical protein
MPPISIFSRWAQRFRGLVRRERGDIAASHPHVIVFGEHEGVESLNKKHRLLLSHPGEHRERVIHEKHWIVNADKVAQV